MSRTYRRPNYELVNMHRKHGRKIAGFYTEYDFEIVYRRHDEEGFALGYYHHYRFPTPREAYITFRDAHCDGVFNQWATTKFWRKDEEHAYRSKERLKIVRYLKGVDDDVVPDRLLRAQKHTWIW